MGRTAKYATLKTYEPYIKVIRKALKIPADANIVVTFTNIRVRSIGKSIYYPSTKYGTVEVSKFQPHNEILRILLHEFRHIWQYASGILRDSVEPYKKTYANYCYWNGTRYLDYTYKGKKYYSEYYNAPWEADAREAEKLLFKLFPGGNLPLQSALKPAPKKRKLVGVVDGIKFYKTHA